MCTQIPWFTSFIYIYIYIYIYMCIVLIQKWLINCQWWIVMLILENDISFPVFPQVEVIFYRKRKILMSQTWGVHRSRCKSRSKRWRTILKKLVGFETIWTLENIHNVKMLTLTITNHIWTLPTLPKIYENTDYAKPYRQERRTMIAEWNKAQLWSHWKKETNKINIINT